MLDFLSAEVYLSLGSADYAIYLYGFNNNNNNNKTKDVNDIQNA